MPLLELNDVHARYGPIRALHGVSLRVDEGEVVALLGANGAGKTTTLRSISSMTRTSGDIVFDGRGIARRSPEYAARLGIAHVPEGRGLFPELTVWENLRMGAVGPGRGRSARLEEEAKRVVGYFPWIGRRRGQPARAPPALPLLEEPSLGLAPTVVRELFAIVHRLNEEEGLTVLVVEQNATIALDVSSRAYVLEGGEVAVEGT